MKKKILIKYENIHIILAIIYSIYQLIIHNLTINNLILEIMILALINSSLYIGIKAIRLNK